MPNDFGRLYAIGKSTLQARQTELQVLSENLANINTPGFKERRVSFQAALDIETGGSAKRGVETNAAVRDFSQGAVEDTGQATDLAIDGVGFFTIRLPSGDTAYTRVGTFRPDSQGRLVNEQGCALSPNITIPANAEGISIDPGGTITTTVNGIPQVLGRLQLARFANPEGLLDVGNGVYAPSDASGAAQTGAPTQNGLGQIVAGALEMSNTTAVQQMTNMIRIQRSYSLGAKALQISDQMAAITNQLQG